MPPGSLSGARAPRTRPPVALGCAVLGALLVVAIVGVVAGAGFLESGASSGRVALMVADAYAPGTVTFEPAQHLYVSRLGSGEMLALDNIDASGGNDAQRCRVAPIPADDPGLSQIVLRYRTRFSAAAAGTGLVFRDPCTNALYDVTGTRVDGDGRNLDRFEVAVQADQRLAVNLGARRCSARRGDATSVAVACGGGTVVGGR